MGVPGAKADGGEGVNAAYVISNNVVHLYAGLSPGSSASPWYVPRWAFTPVDGAGVPIHFDEGVRFEFNLGGAEAFELGNFGQNQIFRGMICNSQLYGDPANKLDLDGYVMRVELRNTDQATRLSVSAAYKHDFFGEQNATFITVATNVYVPAKYTIELGPDNTVTWAWQPQGSPAITLFVTNNLIPLSRMKDVFTQFTHMEQSKGQGYMELNDVGLLAIVPEPLCGVGLLALAVLASRRRRC